MDEPSFEASRLGRWVERAGALKVSCRREKLFFVQRLIGINTVRAAAARQPGGAHLDRDGGTVFAPDALNRR